jgi:hypothetical protein
VIYMCPSFCNQLYQACGGTGNTTTYCESYTNIKVRATSCYNAAPTLRPSLLLLFATLLLASRKLL